MGNHLSLHCRSGTRQTEQLYNFVNCGHGSILGSFSEEQQFLSGRMLPFFEPVVDFSGIKPHQPPKFDKVMSPRLTQE